MSEIVRLISGDEKLVLDACDGKRTIAKAIDIFSYIDPDFKDWDTDVVGEATPETVVAVYEMAEEANFATMFTSLCSDVSKLILTQNQIIHFIQKHGKWLRKDGWETFFLFRVGNEFFVARAYIYPGGELRVFVRRFGYGYVWSADSQRRLVVPQL